LTARLLRFPPTSRGRRRSGGECPRKYDRYVKPVWSKGNLYLYFDTGQTDERKRKIYTRLPDLSDKFAYGTAYAAALTARSRRASGEQDSSQITIPALIDLWQKSPAFRKKAAGTQRVYKYLSRQGRGHAPDRAGRRAYIVGRDSAYGPPRGNAGRR
jgi:hypothetical protein